MSKASTSVEIFVKNFHSVRPRIKYGFTLKRFTVNGAGSEFIEGSWFDPDYIGKLAEGLTMNGNKYPYFLSTSSMRTFPGAMIKAGPEPFRGTAYSAPFAVSAATASSILSTASEIW